MTSGYPSDATENAVQANIVAAGYSTSAGGGGSTGGGGGGGGGTGSNCAAKYAQCGGMCLERGHPSCSLMVLKALASPVRPAVSAARPAHSATRITRNVEHHFFKGVLNRTNLCLQVFKVLSSLLCSTSPGMVDGCNGAGKGLVLCIICHSFERFTTVRSPGHQQNENSDWADSGRILVSVLSQSILKQATHPFIHTHAYTQLTARPSTRPRPTQRRCARSSGSRTRPL
jgi:hypothetical protein